MNLWIGTSGFQYPEWKGNFYPADLSAKKMLPYYAERFSSTESNYSFRRVPSIKTIESWSAATPEHFRFSFKAPQTVTHVAKLRDCAGRMSFFHQAISLMESKLGVVLFQLPPSFKKDAPLLDAFLAILPPRLRAAFEFRHTSWFDDEVFGTLQKHNAALCIAESADLSTPVVATADFGYLRLRRQDYSPEMIAQWAVRIQEQEARWTDAFVYFKHEEAGVGPVFAQQLIDTQNPPL